MVFKNALINGRLTDIEVSEGKIVSMDKTDKDGVDLKGNKVFAGLIDTHIHGCNGYDVMDIDKLCEMSDFLAKHGTTAWLPTTVTASLEGMKAVTDVDIPVNCGAQVLGFHLEGPYISMKYKGAQNPAYIRDMNINEYNQLKNIKKITVAPEIGGGMEFIKECPCCVSIGHTDADYAITAEAIENGATCLTHTFNAMPPIHHRNPGPIGAAFDKGAYVEIIGDGQHVNMTVVRMLYKLFGSDRMIFISDALRCAGMPDGEYELGGQMTYVKGGLARLSDGTIAGSTATMLSCVKNAIKAGIPENEAFKMASETPAKSIGSDKGVLAVGRDADFIVLDNEYNLLNTVIGGELYFEACG